MRNIKRYLESVTGRAAFSNHWRTSTYKGEKFPLCKHAECIDVGTEKARGASDDRCRRLELVTRMATTAAETATVGSYPSVSTEPGTVRKPFLKLIESPSSRTETLAFSTLDFTLPVGPADVSITVSANRQTEIFTRAVNVMVAAIGLLLCLPVIALIALAVKLTSRGPVFYSHTRVGLDRRWKRKSSHEQRVFDLGGRPFTMYKFRTMVHNAEPDGYAVWAMPGDKRITPVGRFLRATRLDEVPQLFNVLRGDMNVVGPRPERPEIFAELRSAIPFYHVRQRVMPGITGWAQINQCYDQCVDDVRRKVDLDLEYLRSRSVGQDLSIMARTVPIMVKRQLGW